MTGDVTNAELARSFKRLESKIDKITEDHETRLRRLERAVWIAAGAGFTGAASGVGALLQVVG